MNEIIELSYCSWSIEEVRRRMREYLELSNDESREDFINLNRYVFNVINSLKLEEKKGYEFLRKIDLTIDELRTLELECYKKWNESNLTKDGKEEVCQEQSVS